MALETFEFSNKKSFLDKIWAPSTLDIPEFQQSIRCTKDQLDSLKKDISNKETSEIKKIIAQFISDRNKIRSDAQKKTDSLKQETWEAKNQRNLDELSWDFTIPKLKNYLEKLEQLEDTDKDFWVNILIWKIQSIGYWIYIEEKSIKVLNMPNSKVALEIETTLNNYLSNNKISLDNFKTVILHRTSKLNDYIDSNTDSKWVILTEKMDTDEYYEYMLKKSWLDKNMFVTQDDIKGSSKLNDNDKLFLLSYKKWTYDWYRMNQHMRQFEETKEYSKAVWNDVDKRWDWAKKDYEKVKWKRSWNEFVRDFMKDPFTEIMNVMVNAWPIGWAALLLSLWYAIFKNPKSTVWLIALWWFGKWTWVLDEMADSFWQNDWKKWTKQTSQTPEKKEDPKQTQKVETNTENLTVAQKEATDRVLVANAEYVKKVDAVSEKNNKPKIEEYVKFINSSDFQEKKISQLFYLKDQGKNIFLNELVLEGSLWIPDKFEPLLFKKILRTYLTGTYKIDDTQNVPWMNEFKAFEKKYSIDSKKAENIKFSELINSIQVKKA